MGPYLLTVFFVSIVALFTTKEINNCLKYSANIELLKELQLENKVYQRLQTTTLFEKEIKQRLVEYKNKELEQAVESNTTKERELVESSINSLPMLLLPLERPPNNSRFNLASIFFEENLRISTLGAFSYIAAAKTLIRNLYVEAEFFSAIPNFEDRFIELLLSWKDNIKDIVSLEEIYIMFNEFPEEQKIVRQMLTGTNDTPPLFYYVCFDYPKNNQRLKKINLFFADEQVLMALFNKKSLVDSLIDERKFLLDLAIEQEQCRINKMPLPIDRIAKNRTDFYKELESKVGQIAHREFVNAVFLGKLLDYHLGFVGDCMIINKTKDSIIMKQIRPVAE